MIQQSKLMMTIVENKMKINLGITRSSERILDRSSANCKRLVRRIKQVKPRRDRTALDSQEINCLLRIIKGMWNRLSLNREP